MIECPHCGERTVAKKRKIMEGWKVSGEIEVCALCGRSLMSDLTSNNSDRKISQLSTMLGEPVLEKITIAPSDEHGKFCRNCQHLIAHPFRAVCACSGEEVTPEGDCEYFKKRDL